MKVGVQVLLYNVDRFILPMIDNCAPYVDRIYATWSPVPWNAYNSAARERFRNKTSPDIVGASPHRDKIVLIRGEWRDEASQRNAALERARADDMDFLIVQDADEFYRPADYLANIRFLEQHRDATYFRGRWYVFWKSTEWVLRYPSEKSILSNNENFAVNCRKPVQFTQLRGVDADWRLAPVVPGPCYHLSWLYSDEEVWEKISTWGHANQVRAREWFDTKWRGWRPSSRCLSPASPSASYWQAVRFVGDLPPGVTALNPPQSEGVPLSRRDRLKEVLGDAAGLCGYRARLAWGSVRKAFESQPSR
jgi:hypothetical protein